MARGRKRGQSLPPLPVASDSSSAAGFRYPDLRFEVTESEEGRPMWPSLRSALSAAAPSPRWPPLSNSGARTADGAQHLLLVMEHRTVVRFDARWVVGRDGQRVNVAVGNRQPEVVADERPRAWVVSVRAGHLAKSAKGLQVPGGT